MSPEILPLLLFLVICLVLLLGYPVAFSLGGTALAFAWFGILTGTFDTAFLEALPNRLYGIMDNKTLIAVPLFVFMGVMLERSRVAENLLDTMAILFGPMRGGLGISVTVVGMLLAASTGIVGATVVTMGLLSLPTMLRRHYDPGISSGIICAAGTLGQIIPPSIVLVLLGDVLSASYQQAQLMQGIYSPETVSVGDLFVGAIVPGLLLVMLYLSYVVVVSLYRPEAVPPIPQEEREQEKGLLLRVMMVLMPPLLLIIAVLGSILGGLATPTEAAGVGAVGALMLAGYRLNNRAALPVLAGLTGFVALLLLRWRFGSLGPLIESPQPSLLLVAVLLSCAAVLWGVVVALRVVRTSGVLGEVMSQTTRITSMVFMIFIGASLFSLVFRGFGGDVVVTELLTNLPGGVIGAMLVVMLVMFLLGFILDFIEITFVVVPIVGPILLAMGLDPVWLGVMIAINLQTSFLTPPFGFSLFYLRGVAPASVSTAAIYRGVIPFILIQLLMLGMLAYWPELATWLPDQVYGD